MYNVLIISLRRGQNESEKRLGNAIDSNIREAVLVRRFGMKEQNELHENLAESPPTQAGKDAPNKATLAAVLYYIFNLIYFLLFLGSCPYVLLSPMIFDGGDSLNARIGFFLIVGFPVAVIAIMWGARYFYRKGQIRSAFLTLLLPPLFYLVFLLLQAFYWSL
jgi:hypothetical protein